MSFELEFDVDYYDKILAGISLSLVMGTLIGVLTTIPLPYGVGSGALVAIGLMYDGMFRNGPPG